jgi:hypothetical protein
MSFASMFVLYLNASTYFPHGVPFKYSERASTSVVVVQAADPKIGMGRIRVL